MRATTYRIVKPYRHCQTGGKLTPGNWIHSGFLDFKVELGCRHIGVYKWTSFRYYQRGMNTNLFYPLLDRSFSTFCRACSHYSTLLSSGKLAHHCKACVRFVFAQQPLVPAGLVFEQRHLNMERKADVSAIDFDTLFEDISSDHADLLKSSLAESSLRFRLFAQVRSFL